MDAESQFARKLNHLFDTVRKPDGSQYTNEDLEKGTGGALTRVYAWKLRKGAATNPGFHIVQALADFFKIEAGYFFESRTQPVEDRAPTLAEQVGRRIYELDEDGQRSFLQLLEYTISLSKKGKKSRGNR